MKILFCKSLLSALLYTAFASHAAQPLPNGDFETGTLTGWTNNSTSGAVATIVQRGSCFSAHDTTGLNIRGANAALLRSNANGDRSSEAIITSSAFSAGDGVAFIALSESVVGLVDQTVNLTVQLLDASNDAIIISQSINTARAQLYKGCPSTADSTSFRSHYVSTRAYTGNRIKLRLIQSTKIKGSSFFTLIDQVALFNQGEQPIFHTRPHPQAGVSETNWGTPHLDSSGSFDPDKTIEELSFSWYIDNEPVRDFRNPCVADLSDGNHTAVLYVNDGQHLISDVIQFVIDEPDSLRTAFTAQEPESAFASIDPVAQDPECQSVLADYIVPVNSPDVDVNDPFGTISTEDDDPTDDTGTNDGDNDGADQTSTASSNTVIGQFRALGDSSGNSTASSVGGSNNSATFSEAYNLVGSGIRWKPVSEGDGNLVVLTPSQFPETTTLLIGANNATIEIAESVGRTNGDRATYRFNRPGSAYPSNIVLRVGNTDYKVVNPGADIR